MGISVYNIKRWIKMMTGNSIYHVEQGMGKVFLVDQLEGYFNDMTQKVLLGDDSLDENGIPVLEHSDGTKVHMPTMIFQYGLGAYDLWLIEKEKKYLDKAIKCANWAVENQKNNGAWNNFFYIYPEAPYSAMPQGEAVSLLVRIYKETNKNIYLSAAKKAINFMMTDVDNGGVTQYKKDELILLEYTHLPVVINGWIFAIFGLYDFAILTGQYKNELIQTIESLKKELPKYNCGYWSMYDNEGKIASPFYHKLHIAQMKALYKITNAKIFEDYAKIFEVYQDNWLNRKKAFVKKVFQKILD